MARLFPCCCLKFALNHCQPVRTGLQTGSDMFRFLAILALAFGLFSTATTANARVSWGEELRLVDNAELPNFQGGSVAVCHLTAYADFLFVPVYTRIKSYALSNSGCTGTQYHDLSTADFQAMQASGLINPNLPPKPRAGLLDIIWGHAWIIVLMVGVVFKGVIFAGERRVRKPGSADPLAIHSLVAMSQVAVADGHIDAREVQQISYILTRLNGAWVWA